MRNKNIKLVIFSLSLTSIITFTSCSISDSPETPSKACAPDLSEENKLLRAEIAALKAENEELKVSAPLLLAAINTEVNAGNLEKSEAALKRLVDKYPNTKESNAGKKLVDRLVAKRLANEKEAKRVAALGLKALKIASTFTYGDTTIELNNANISMRWNFDYYDDEYHYKESEKDSQFITANVTVSSKSKSPSLFGIGVYVEDGGHLNSVGNFEYRFVRWDDYGSYLGNTADYSNDFAHNSSIPFSLGASVTDENLKRPLYLVITREGCNMRLYNEFGQPPIHYSSIGCSSLKNNLAIDDFKDGSLAILMRID